ncbi:hypothetical protein A3A63_01140 [Candidatus Gottesmanbacteria bacterium RIFCSPLOWO2_01_FULL_46_9]|uniref:Uncharacterized protein n=1 Tax=Candidatus Gottesmanbacteria bacterium RIFCSPLOWO2_01_FULL_46_9 TaxID=1798394 RepID=A0A1F6B2W1_9BACT|nr:MAG: hypothetical protein A3A63_01140 [Candidatus Gottesmanbacteria bacterium RIFCSPLOWO2_01_FULL_46_9]
MKTVDVSARVMKKIAGFERRRIAAWIRWFLAVVASLIIGCSVLLLLVVKDLMEKRTFDMLELFTEDREIIAEFWKDVLETFWDELPQEMLLVIAVMLAVLVLFVIVTAQKRRIIQKKLHQLEKYP